jgi:hypothetical protein
MERFAVIAGLLVAAGFALGSLGSGVHVNWDFSDEVFEQDTATPADPSQIVTLAPKAYAAQSIRIDGVVAVVTLIPEDRTDIELAIDNAGPLATPKVNVDQNVLAIDGGFGGGMSCRDTAGVRIQGVGAVARDSLPRITARVPRDVVFSGDGVVFLDVATAQSADVELSRCSDAKFADLAGALTLNIEGAAEANAGAVQTANIRVSGAGTVILASVREALDATIEGAGDLTVNQAAGTAAMRISGSGDIAVNAATLSTLDANIEGSGDLSIDGNVSGLAKVEISGSGDIDVSGSVGDLEALIQGSGEIEVGQVQRGMRQEVHGSGTVSVRGQGEGTRTLTRQTTIINENGATTRTEIAVQEGPATKGSE